mgnify:CR=1 FL=1
MHKLLARQLRRATGLEGEALEAAGWGALTKRS